MKTLTLSVCRRPEYTRQTMLAMRACVGISEYRVGVFVDRQCEATLSVAAELLMPGWHLETSIGHWGCNRAIWTAMSWGFAQSAYHVHLEDDTLPAKDFLKFCEWAAQFGDDPTVLSVTGYARTDEPPDVAHRRDWFTPWGWATWADRWQELSAAWAPNGPVSWDTHIARHLKRDRVEIAPGLSRIQNIGEHGGTHNNPHFWATDQFTPFFAGDQHECSQYRLV